MIYIVNALAAEAIPIIKALGLKKDISYIKFDVFKSEHIRLIISGTGKLKSAMAVMYLLVKEPPRPEDRIINFGIAGSGVEEHKIGEAFIINKIEDHATAKAFYPETVFKHNLPEQSIMTYDRPVKRKEATKPPQCLVDMESSGFYDAASLFFHSHRIHILKVVSDHLRAEKLTGAFLQSLVEKNISTIKNLINQSNKVPAADANVLNSKDYNLFENLSSELKLSTTQRFQVLDLMKGYKVRSGNDVEFLKTYIKKKGATKQENKKLFEEIVEKLEDV
jgi:nucleoside phosphorylase